MNDVSPTTKNLPPTPPKTALATKISPTMKKWITGVVAVLVVAIGALAWHLMQPKGLPEGFASSNGRIEATEIDVATKLPGRLTDIYVKEGELVKAGQVVAQMDVETLEAQRAEARAKLDQATHAVATSQAEVNVRKSDMAAAQSMVAQRETELDAARRRLARTETLSKEGAESIQRLDDDRATVRSAEAAVSASQARVAAAQSAIVAAETQSVGTRSTVAAAQASIDRITADINDSQLKAPRDGRVQFKVTQPGEVLYPGGKVLNLVDLTDVYMTFFLPEQIAGRLAVGSEARIVLDAAPQWVIPATVTFVADVAQFTPKTVETAEERQKLTFRIKAHIPADLLRKHITVVKTGLPGVAYVKVDPNAAWPANLAPKPPELAQ